MSITHCVQVALLCIMAQVGSFIPAESAVLSTLDAVYTRMGASDHILVGRSTFMTELMVRTFLRNSLTFTCSER